MNSQEREREPKRTTIRLGDTRINLRLGPGALALARLTLGYRVRICARRHSSRGSVRCCEPGALTSFYSKPDVEVDYLPYLAALFSGFGLRTTHGVLCGLFSDTNSFLLTALVIEIQNITHWSRLEYFARNIVHI
ncbi:hypothetical protein ALC53_05589 [Atta colombica]|uniref:Uncharacterized protein n=1 Tax=Atta colombica TaxID=520822 RepID=A0A151I4S1_9HYME|nr:hypothetical protein ALC53_05589 [Atta colombica]